jgi:hypothetical protein
MRNQKAIIFDTSVLCCWLKVPGKDTCGPQHDQWNFERILDKIEQEKKNSSIFVLPLATIIETGNHISQVDADRHALAKSLADLVRKTATETEPWAAFSQQSALWEKENLKKLADTWPDLAAQKLSIGDATIKDVADYYAKAHCNVEILTGDQGLKAYQPTTPQLMPRRRAR